MAVCLIGLGSNLGDRREILQQALSSLGKRPQLRILASSSLHETRAVGGPPGQESFLNAAATLETSLAPAAVLAVLAEVEEQLGRCRKVRWGPRTIDLDLLLYDERILSTADLVVPHPRMAWRRFVLEPAAEIAPAMVHPATGWSIARLLDHLNTAADYVALAGAIGVGKSFLAGKLAAAAGAELVGEELDLGRLEQFYADPAGGAWAMEIEFLRQRARLLAADHPRWSRPQQLVCSDFWFEQSLAFAAVWLPPQRQDEFVGIYRQARRDVVQPKLTVLLDVPLGELVKRVTRRGRPCERGLKPEQQERIRRSILSQANRPGQGPVLRLTLGEVQPALDEILAAVEAMK